MIKVETFFTEKILPPERGGKGMQHLMEDLLGRTVHFTEVQQAPNFPHPVVCHVIQLFGSMQNFVHPFHEHRVFFFAHLQVFHGASSFRGEWEWNTTHYFQSVPFSNQQVRSRDIALCN